MREIYNYRRFKIIQCVNCFSSTVSKMPSDKEIIEYYKGFMFKANVKKKTHVVNDSIKNWFLSFNLPAGAKMLDIGGGGGFYSYAFKQFTGGEPYYIDLDQEACDFARNELKLKKVVNDDVDNINKYYDTKFNFIFCRHVIEHLRNPVELIRSGVNLLSDEGVFVLLCPNGISFERLGYRHYFKRPVKELYRANREWSKLKAIKTMFSKQICAINPINHLWSITEKGLSAYLKAIDGITFNTKTAPITDKVYSPWQQKEGFWKIFHSNLVANTLGRVHGSNHLVAIIRKKK